jgi:FeS assembly SUF system regulator
MIRLSRLTDYAIVIVAELSQTPGQLQAAAGLADKIKIPEPTVAKVLKILARGGVLESARGVNGGYVVTRALDAISVGEVIAAMNGPTSLTACIEEGEDECNIANTCLLRGRWGPLNIAIQNAFASVKLSDMIRPACSVCPTHATFKDSQNG